MNIKSYNDLQEHLKSSNRAFLLLYKAGSEQSNCALNNLKEIGLDEVLIADVKEVRDIHGKYGITTVPALLTFEGPELRNIYKGCQDKSYLESVLKNEVFNAASNVAEDKPRKRVTVFSTPTCPWCTRMKDHLKKNNIRFRDVDVSVDQNAANDMVSRSGQRGVPQIDINGTMIVGFDQNRIDQLLDIK
ncbi:MAG TPA: NrdH-redoxin [Flavobacteriales bacterium]|nr:NrdH-redoxin [Flavobacteriales bacterium]